MQLDTRKLGNVIIEDKHLYIIPDFVDALVEYAEINGVELTDAQYDEVNEDAEFLNGDTAMGKAGGPLKIVLRLVIFDIESLPTDNQTEGDMT